MQKQHANCTQSVLNMTLSIKEDNEEVKGSIEGLETLSLSEEE